MVVTQPSGNYFDNSIYINIDLAKALCRHE